MGKKKKSFFKKQIRPFVNGNQLVLAALGGAVAGYAISNLLGTEKAKQLLDTVQSSVKEFSDKMIGATNQNPKDQKSHKTVPAM